MLTNVSLRESHRKISIFQSSEIRTSNNAVKYARFHDEETMRGDNIETIFTAH